MSVSQREPTRSDMFGGYEHYDDTKGILTTTPEIVHDVEVGYSAHSDKVTANINGFFMKFKNELVLNGESGTNGLPCHENVENSYRGGLEVSIDYEPVDGLHLINNSSFSKNIMKSELYGVKNHIMSPEWTVNQDINYTRGIFSVGLNYNMRSSVYFDMSNEHKLPCSMTLNAYASLLFKKHFEVSVRFRNITNRVNYMNAAIGADNEVLYVQDGKFSCFANFKYLF